MRALQVRLAKKLVQASFADKVFFANSGTEANEAALKFSRKFARVQGVPNLDPVLQAHNPRHFRILLALHACRGAIKCRRPSCSPVVPK